jgi:hypothetical protein
MHRGSLENIKYLSMVMTRYIEQILEDIRDAELLSVERVRNVCSPNEDEEYHIVIDENSTGGIKLSKLFDIDKIFFPEKSLLDSEQILVMVNAIESLWRAYGLNPVFHADLPEESKYCLLRNYLDQKVYPVYGNLVDVELCDYNQHDCPFINWCSVAADQKEGNNRKNISA